MTLVAAMSAICPSNEVDELTVALLTIFERRGLSFDLLEVLIKQEIEETGMMGIRPTVQHEVDDCGSNKWSRK